jgi:hypothetical protein
VPAPVGRSWGIVATLLALLPVPFWLGEGVPAELAPVAALAIAVMPVIATVLPALAPDRYRKAAVYLATFLLLPFAVGFVFLYGPPFLVLLVAAVIQYRRSLQPARR